MRHLPARDWAAADRGCGVSGATVAHLTTGSVLVMAPDDAVVDLDGLVVDGSLLIDGNGVTIKNVTVKGPSA